MQCFSGFRVGKFSDPKTFDRLNVRALCDLLEQGWFAQQRVHNVSEYVAASP